MEKMNFIDMQIQVEVLNELVRIIGLIKYDPCFTTEMVATELLKVVDGLTNFQRFDILGL